MAAQRFEKDACWDTLLPGPGIFDLPLPGDHMQAVEQEVPTAHDHRGASDPQQRNEQYRHCGFSITSKTHFVT